MAVALKSSTYSKVRPTSERRHALAPVRLVVAGVAVALVAMAVVSGSWLGLAVVAGLFLVGTSLLASADEPLSASQAAAVGAIHLVAGALLAL